MGTVPVNVLQMNCEGVTGTMRSVNMSDFCLLSCLRVDTVSAKTRQLPFARVGQDRQFVSRSIIISL